MPRVAASSSSTVRKPWEKSGGVDGVLVAATRPRLVGGEGVGERPADVDADHVRHRTPCSRRRPGLLRRRFKQQTTTFLCCPA